MTGRGINRRRSALMIAAMTIASLAVVGVDLSGTSAHASTASALRFDYNLVGTTGTAANSAPTGPTAAMTLIGPWTSVADGVQFSGDLVGHASVGYAKPSGNTLNQAASTAVGIGVHFRYTAPTSGGCFGDSLNLTQIGKFGADMPQAKLQLTNCHDSKTAEFMQCRFAGSLTPATVLPVTSSVALANGHSYVVTCRKTADAKGASSVVFKVTDLSAAGGPKTVTQTFSIAALGAMKTAAYLSVGNKYPLPTPASDNTDQFQGVISRSVVCVGKTTEVTSCLATYAGA